MKPCSATSAPRPVERVPDVSRPLPTLKAVGRVPRSETTAKLRIPRPSTRGAAITAFCKGCIYDPGALGTWREQTAACTDGGCALFAFRPIPRGIGSGSPALSALRSRLDTDGRAGDGPR